MGGGGGGQRQLPSWDWGSWCSPGHWDWVVSVDPTQNFVHLSLSWGDLGNCLSFCLFGVCLLGCNCCFVSISWMIVVMSPEMFSDLTVSRSLLRGDVQRVGLHTCHESLWGER